MSVYATALVIQGHAEGPRHGEPDPTPDNSHVLFLSEDVLARGWWRLSVVDPEGTGALMLSPEQVRRLRDRLADLTDAAPTAAFIPQHQKDTPSA